MKTRLFLPRQRFQDLIDALHQAGYRCVGPRVRDGAIVYDTVQQVTDLPAGVHDAQAPGSYRIESDGEPRLFAWANGPQALKPLLFAPDEVLWRAERDADGRIAFQCPLPQARPVAVIGVRACDLAALRIHDAHFLHSTYTHTGYAARRLGLFTVAVHCSHPADTCFCVSTGDGPTATHTFDIALGELDEGFVAEGGSDAGEVLLEGLKLPAAETAQLEALVQQAEQAAARQTRKLPGRHLRDALFENLHHPRWEEVAARCLSCGNCTSVCPTCFCHRESDQPALDGGSTEHLREWDSCFTQGHSYIHGLTVRPDTGLRYRQWLTHKLGSWHDQFGRSGCVGCGRCIAWCPTGIDITEEAAAICGIPA